MTRAGRSLAWYLDLFGEDRFFIELQQHQIPELPMVNKKLLEIGRRNGAKFIATNDVPLYQSGGCTAAGYLVGHSDRQGFWHLPFTGQTRCEWRLANEIWI